MVLVKVKPNVLIMARKALKIMLHIPHYFSDFISFYFCPYSLNFTHTNLLSSLHIYQTFTHFRKLNLLFPLPFNTFFRYLADFVFHSLGLCSNVTPLTRSPLATLFKIAMSSTFFYHTVLLCFPS